MLAGPPNRNFGSLEAAMAPDRPPMPDAFSGSAVNVPGTRASRNLLANPDPVASRRPKLLNVVGVRRRR